MEDLKIQQKRVRYHLVFPDKVMLLITEDDTILNYTAEDLNYAARGNGFANNSVGLKLKVDRFGERFLVLNQEIPGVKQLLSVRPVIPCINFLYHSLDIGQDFTMDIVVDEDTGKLRDAESVGQILSRELKIEQGNEPFKIIHCCRQRGTGHHERKLWDLIISLGDTPLFILPLECV